MQEACARLLTRLRGSRAPVLNQSDLQAVLGTWKPPNASGTLRDMLVEHAETNLCGAAQAAIWLLAERSTFSLEELDQVLRDGGFTDMDTGQLGEVAQALRVSGVCEADGDRYRFAIPLLKSAVADLNIRHRVERLAIDWRSKTPASKARFDFWGGNGNRG